MPPPVCSKPTRPRTNAADAAHPQNYTARLIGTPDTSSPSPRTRFVATPAQRPRGHRESEARHVVSSGSSDKGAPRRRRTLAVRCGQRYATLGMWGRVTGDTEGARASSPKRSRGRTPKGPPPTAPSSAKGGLALPGVVSRDFPLGKGARPIYPVYRRPPDY